MPAGDYKTVPARTIRWSMIWTVTLLQFAYSASSFSQTTLLQGKPIADANWAGFRGPGGQGIADAQNLPLKWSESENILWKFSMPGPGASSPIVFEQHIYVTCYSGFFVPGEDGGSQKNLKRHLICVNRNHGARLWQKVIDAKLPEEDRIRDHGFAANSPAADADHVYCFFGKTGVFAFDHSGEQVWQADVGSKTSGWGTSASPVLYKDLVFINASVESESLIALDRNTGKEIWRTAEIKEAWNTPVVVKNVNGISELVIATHGSIRGYEPDTGKRLWTCATDIGWYMVPSIVADQGIVYCLGGRSGIASLAVRTGGMGDVTKTHRLWTGLKGSNVSSPVVHKGQVYWMNDNLGIAYCAKAESGEIVYEKRMHRAGQVYASALLANGRIYYVTREGKTYVVAAKPDFEVLSENDLRDGSVFNGSFAVDGARLLLRSDKFLYSIGK